MQILLHQGPCVIVKSPNDYLPPKPGGILQTERA